MLPGNKGKHYGAIRNIESRPFDVLIAVHLDVNFAPLEAFSVEWQAVRKFSRYNAHVPRSHPGHPQYGLAGSRRNRPIRARFSGRECIGHVVRSPQWPPLAHSPALREKENSVVVGIERS